MMTVLKSPPVVSVMSHYLEKEFLTLGLTNDLQNVHYTESKIVQEFAYKHGFSWREGP